MSTEENLQGLTERRREAMERRIEERIMQRILGRIDGIESLREQLQQQMGELQIRLQTVRDMVNMADEVEARMCTDMEGLRSELSTQLLTTLTSTLDTAVATEKKSFENRMAEMRNEMNMRWEAIVRELNSGPLGKPSRVNPNGETDDEMKVSLDTRVILIERYIEKLESDAAKMREKQHVAKKIREQRKEKRDLQREQRKEERDLHRYRFRTDQDYRDDYLWRRREEREDEFSILESRFG